MERDTSLDGVHDALIASAREVELSARLRVLATALSDTIGGATMIVVHDDALRTSVGTNAVEQSATLPAPAWRRWMRLLRARRERFAAAPARADVYALPLDDPWVQAEFGRALVSTDRGATAPAGLLLAPAIARDGALLATVVQEVPDGWPPNDSPVRAVDLVATQTRQYVEHAMLEALASGRAERLQRLQDAGAALARSLDEAEIVRELARQVARLVPADGLVIAQPDLERGVVRTALRLVGPLTRPRADQPLGAGPIAEAARSGAVIRVDDYDPARVPLAANDDLVGDAGPAGSVLAAPMRVGTQLVGVVAVHASATRAYRPDDEELLRAVAGQAGTAIVNARLFAESEAERRQSEALADVARAVGSSLRFGEVLRLILRHTSALLHAGGACVALERDEYLHIVAGVGTASVLAGVHVPVASSMMGRALREGRPFISNSVASEDGYYRPLQRLASLEKAVLVPLVGAEGPIGVIAAINRSDDFGEVDARVLRRLADHVAVAIVNARLFERVTAATREWKVAFDAIAAGMVVLDEHGAVVRCNQRAADLAGVPGPKALLARDFREALGFAPSDDDAPDVIASALGLGETTRAAVRGVVGESRREAWLEVLAAPHPDGGAVVTFDDVTAERRRAEQAAQHERLATVGRLVRGIAHELANPLTSVLALADLLVVDTDEMRTDGHVLDTADVRDAALAIRAEARRASRIMGKLHAFARQRPPERATTDLNRVVLDALDLRRYALRMQQVDIEMDLDYELPLTWADPVQLQQVFLQLITAAEQSLGEVKGGRRLTVRTRRIGQRLETSFIDTGAGYSAAAAARLVEPFGGEGGDEQDAALAVSSEIVREHGGRLRVESTPGAGATLVVELPHVPPPDAEIAAAPSSSARVQP